MVTQTEFNQQPLWLRIIRLLRWDKPAGRLILMIPALEGVFLAADGMPPLPLVGVIILGSLATSAAGCVINDLWDRNIDPQVERTKNRPLASKSLSIKIGIIVAIIALFCAAVLAFYLQPISFWLCLAAVPVIVCYPLAKRFFPIPQLVLSIAWGFAVLISWSAVTNDLSENTWLLWGATVCWTLGFDTIYALADREDDLAVGVKSSAIFFGNFAPEAVGIFFALTIGLLAYLGLMMQLQISFWIAWGICVVIWVIQYITLRYNTEPEIYGQFFRQNVLCGLILLAGMILA